jgi:hypothetical protein
LLFPERLEDYLAPENPVRFLDAFVASLDLRALEKAFARIRQAERGKRQQRKALCEHPFGTIKQWFGYTHFLLKGLVKVRTEWSLMTLVYNLNRVLNLVSFEKLMAAVAYALASRSG